MKFHGARTKQETREPRRGDGSCGHGPGCGGEQALCLSPRAWAELDKAETTFQSKLGYLQGQLRNIQDPVQNESAGAQKVRKSAIKGTIFYHSFLFYAIPIFRHKYKSTNSYGNH